MSGGRHLGADLARFVALLGLIGMVVAEGEPEWLAWVVDGPPVLLLAVVLGVDAVLAAERRLARGDAGGAVRAMMLRGMLLAALGLVLGTATFWVWGFLVPLGAAVATASVALLLPTWAVGALATGVLLGAGWCIAAARAVLPTLEHTHSITTLVREPYATVADVALTGMHPAIALLGGVLLGVAVGRLLAAREGERERSLLAGAAVVGAALLALAVAIDQLTEAWLRGDLDAALSPAALEMLLGLWSALVPHTVELQLLAEPYSASAVELARMVGLALLALGSVGLLAGALRGSALAWADIPRSFGNATITMWSVAAVLRTATIEVGELAPWLEGWAGWVTSTGVGVIVVSAAMRGGRGAIEAGIDALAERGAGGRRPALGPVSLPDDVSFEYETQLRAPIGVVWRALTEPAHILQWMHEPARAAEMRFDVRPGGSMSWRTPLLFSTHRVVIDLVRMDAPTTLVQALRYEGGPVILTSVDRLFEFDGVTTIRTRNTCPDRRIRDRALAARWATARMHERLATFVERQAAGSGTMVG
ncbi:SRPBCC family protein [Agrococcus carbonis]|uniref:Activator of Hsp90 ATPase homolog 1-like protein n=1 Tax=Agrococcus carbonis TaxID=684552 RepID=A0A1H1RVS0_9MICO|nr:SRPBCC domain-containing protein [Agrococcus carbonis]SDS39743.1 Activator of Hsp90 ATPase homolog 1-like protein [Agrococcus carbonis]